MLNSAPLSSYSQKTKNYFERYLLLLALPPIVYSAPSHIINNRLEVLIDFRKALLLYVVGMYVLKGAFIKDVTEGGSSSWHRGPLGSYGKDGPADDTDIFHFPNEK